ncbi:MAG TPA: response regulator [Chloroflexota bacterium]|nr:response regulator [Chloroflexota bacterium]
MRITCLDDDSGFLDLLRWAAEERGWQVSVHDEAVSALQEIPRLRPDVIMLDLRLGPGLSGWDVIALLERDARTVGMPIIVCSAAIDDLQRGQADLERRGIRFLPKPFDIDDLYRIVEEVAAAATPRSVAGA